MTKVQQGPATTTTAMNNPPAQFAKDDLLRSAISVGGLSEIKILYIEEEDQYVTCVRTLNSEFDIYLATRRNPSEPRRFKRVDVAIEVMQRLTGADRFIVLMKPNA